MTPTKTVAEKVLSTMVKLIDGAGVLKELGWKWELSLIGDEILPIPLRFTLQSPLTYLSATVYFQPDLEKPFFYSPLVALLSAYLKRDGWFHKTAAEAIAFLLADALHDHLCRLVERALWEFYQLSIRPTNHIAVIADDTAIVVNETAASLRGRAAITTQVPFSLHPDGFFAAVSAYLGKDPEPALIISDKYPIVVKSLERALAIHRI
jgi:hypothetical protein